MSREAGAALLRDMERQESWPEMEAERARAELDSAEDGPQGPGEDSGDFTFDGGDSPAEGGAGPFDDAELGDAGSELLAARTRIEGEGWPVWGKPRVPSLAPWNAEERRRLERLGAEGWPREPGHAAAGPTRPPVHDGRRRRGQQHTQLPQPTPF